MHGKVGGDRAAGSAMLLKNQPPPLPQAGDTLLKARRRGWERNLLFLVPTLGFVGFAMGVSVSANFAKHLVAISSVSTVVLVGVFAYFKLFWEKRSDEEYRRWEVGRKGELVTADQLNECAMENGFRVLHSIPGDGEFDLDHVVFSVFGIWALDTTVLSCGNGHVVTYDGKDISGAAFGREKLEQARAGARWLSEFLRRATGREFAVRACLCVPGAYVKGSFAGDVWVMNPKAFGVSVLRGRQVLGKEEMLLAYESVKAYVRSKNADWYKG